MNTTVTKEEVLANMQNVVCRTVMEFGKPTTYVTVQMKNGFTLRDSTTCVDPKNYSEETGKRICLQRIEEKVWFLLGYALQEKLAFLPKSSTNQSGKNKKMVSIPLYEYDRLVERSRVLKEIEREIEQIEIEEAFCGFLSSIFGGKFECR